jgi:hypothetical protein
MAHLPPRGVKAVLQALVPLPVGTPVRALIVLLVGAALILAARRLTPASRRALARPAAAIVAALAALAVAWVPFLGADLPPTAQGLENRGNLVAGFAMSLLVLGVAWLSGEIAANLTRRAWAGRVAAVLVVATIGTGWLLVARSHVEEYARAARTQDRILNGLMEGVPSPPADATILSLGSPAQSARGVPVFSETWDLNGAVRLLWDDRTLHGFPIVGSARLKCTKRSIVPKSPRAQARVVLGSGLSRKQAGGYGQVFIYDGRTGRVILVRDRKECQRVVDAVPPGPILPP